MRRVVSLLQDRVPIDMSIPQKTKRFSFLVAVLLACISVLAVTYYRHPAPEDGVSGGVRETNVQPVNPLIEMIDANEIDKALDEVEKTADVNARGPEGRTPLLAAVTRAGVYKNAEKHLAYERKRKKPPPAEQKARLAKINELAQTLIRMKKNQADNTETQAVWAELQGLKISSMASLWEDTALPDSLARKKYIKLIFRLLDKGADISLVSADGQTALGNAVRSTDAGMVEILIKRGADIRLAGEPGASLLDQCFDLAGGRDVALLLVNAGAELNAGRGSQCDSLPLQQVIRMGENKEHQIRLLTAMLRQGAEVNGMDPCKRTPLISAIWARDPVLVKFLIENDADINRQNATDGRTPLMEALVWGSPEVVQVLIDKGADFNRKDCDGLTAFAMAKNLDQPELVKMLWAAGAR